MRVSPATGLLAAVLLCAALCALAIGVAHRQPWLGLSLVEGTTLVRVGAIEIRPTDRVDDPDVFGDPRELEEFYARQTQIASELRASEVSLETRDNATPPVSRTFTLSPARTRPLATLPPTFWVPLFVGAMSFLVSCWVLVLRPGLFGAQMFALTGAMLVVSAFPTAIYGTREIALDGDLFRLLSRLNSFGACLFGCALVSLFLAYPRDLGPRWLRAATFVVFVPFWVLAVLLGVVGSPVLGVYVPMIAQTVLLLGLVVVQWRLCRGDPRDRAALRWLGLSAITSAGLWVVTMAAPLVLGTAPLLTQNHAFGFFLVFYVGLALGLRRYRLFDLDEWAFRIVLWVGGALTFVGLDAVLILLLGLDARISSGLVLVACGFGYLPVRNWLWARIPGRAGHLEQELFPQLIEVAFAVTADERAERWNALLRRVFDPLQVEAVETFGPVPQLEDGGLSLVVPSAAASSPLRLAYPFRGRSLFGPRHLHLVGDMVKLAEHADQSRESYDRGAREERRRIARDLHDDMGARLLSALHKDDLDGVHRSIRDAIGDMRAIVSTLDGANVPLEGAVADIRRETAERLANAKIALDWPIPSFSDGIGMTARVARHYVSMVRECVSNAIRHSGATRVEVTVVVEKATAITTVTDDGARVPEDQAFDSGGRGMENLRQRASDVAGSLVLARGEGKTTITIRLPLA